ncbi:transposase family protein [Saccharothrix texasensis]|uniref:transposase family protein n=1 Tax=Saccharothrix texasensis TaxID=103734 RepID=UPI000F4C6B7F|nr:transposase family protein [Saccharothrix texasensis]
MAQLAKLVGAVFSGLSALSVEDVEDVGDVIVVRASTRGHEVACPACGTSTDRVHAFHERVLADVPVDGRRVLVRLRIRRMRCPVAECGRWTFRVRFPR